MRCDSVFAEKFTNAVDEPKPKFCRRSVDDILSLRDTSKRTMLMVLQQIEVPR